MAIIIPSKNIYSIENQKSLSNRIKNVGAEVNRTTVYRDENALSYSPDLSVSNNIWDITYNNVGGIQYRRTEQYYLDINYLFKPTSSLKNLNLEVQYNTKSEWYTSVINIPESTLSNKNYSDPIRNHINLSGASSNVSEYSGLPPLIKVDNVSNQWDLSIPITVKEIAQNTYKIEGRVRLRTTLALTEVSAYDPRSSQYEENTLTSMVIKISADTVQTDGVTKVFDDSKEKTDIIIDTNELFQENTVTSDQPSWLYISQNIIKEYQNGKEIIRLKCSISDYFDEDGEKVIDTKNANINLINTKQLPKSFQPVDGYIYQYPISMKEGYYSTKISIKDNTNIIDGFWMIRFDDVDGNEIYRTSNVSDNSNEKITFSISQDQADKIYYARIYVNALSHGVGVDTNFNVMMVEGKTLPEYEPRKSMCFEIDDTVIPMSYTALGKDAPMSTQKDGIAKKFSVIGVSLGYDGAVFQDLTLQEIAE